MAGTFIHFESPRPMSAPRNKTVSAIEMQIPDGRFKTLMVDDGMTAGDAIREMVKRCAVRASANLSLIEYLPSLFIERLIEDHVVITTVVQGWPVVSDNKLRLIDCPTKYAMFERGQSVECADGDGPKQPADSIILSESLKNELAHTPCLVPRIVGKVYFRLEGGGSWKKVVAALRGSEIQVKSRKKPSSVKHTISIADSDLYCAVGWKKGLKAPTNDGFALKSSALTGTTAYFCCPDEDTLSSWLAAIRLVKYGHRLTVSRSLMVDFIAGHRGAAASPPAWSRRPPTGVPTAWHSGLQPGSAGDHQTPQLSQTAAAREPRCCRPSEDGPSAPTSDASVSGGSFRSTTTPDSKQERSSSSSAAASSGDRSLMTTPASSAVVVSRRQLPTSVMIPPWLTTPSRPDATPLRSATLGVQLPSAPLPQVPLPPRPLPPTPLPPTPLPPTPLPPALPSSVGAGSTSTPRPSVFCPPFLDELRARVALRQANASTLSPAPVNSRLAAVGDTPSTDRFYATGKGNRACAEA